MRAQVLSPEPQRGDRAVATRSRRVATAAELFLLHVFAHRTDHQVQFAARDRVELVDGQADAMIGDAVLLEVVRADLRPALAAADLILPQVRPTLLQL